MSSDAPDAPGPADEPTLGFRTPRPTRRPVLGKVVGAVVLAVFVAYVVGEQMAVRSALFAAESKDARFWMVDGPPCPAVTQAQVRQSGVRLGKGFEMAGVIFERGYGDVSCRDFHSKVRKTVGADTVCQFTGPSVLRVQAPTGELYFQLGASRATVAVSKDEVRCVMAANYRPMANDP